MIDKDRESVRWDVNNTAWSVFAFLQVSLLLTGLDARPHKHPQRSRKTVL